MPLTLNRAVEQAAEVTLAYLDTPEYIFVEGMCDEEFPVVDFRAKRAKEFVTVIDDVDIPSVVDLKSLLADLKGCPLGEIDDNPQMTMLKDSIDLGISSGRLGVLPLHSAPPTTSLVALAGVSQ